MSTVRMSDQLQRDIAREAINTYDKANPERDIASDMGNKMYDKYLKQKHENMQTFLLSEVCIACSSVIITPVLLINNFITW